MILCVTGNQDISILPFMCLFTVSKFVRCAYRVILLVVLNTFFVYRLYALESQTSGCALFRLNCIVLFSIY